MNLNSKFVFTAMLLNCLLSQSNVIDGVAVIVDESIILKSEVGELLQMSMMQRNLTPMINSEEAKNLLSSKYQDKIANGIANAVIIYKNKHEKHIFE